MGTKERLADDMKEAMKSKDRLKLSTIRLVRAEIKNAEIEKGESLNEDDVTGVLARELKKRRESMVLYEEGGRPELVEKEGKEAAILEEYLPEQLGHEEVEALVDEAIEATGAGSVKEIGKVMGVLMPKVKGRADGTVVSGIVKAKLGAG